MCHHETMWQIYRERCNKISCTFVFWNILCSLCVLRRLPQHCVSSAGFVLLLAGPQYRSVHIRSKDMLKFNSCVVLLHGYQRTNASCLLPLNRSLFLLLWSNRRKQPGRIDYSAEAEDMISFVRQVICKGRRNDCIGVMTSRTFKAIVNGGYNGDKTT